MKSLEVNSNYIRAFFFLLFGLSIILVFGKLSIYDEMQKDHWQESKAKVTFCNLQTNASNKKQYLIIRWRYSVKGKKYFNEKRIDNKSNFWLKKKYTREKTIHVRFNPENPQDSVLWSWKELSKTAKAFRWSFLALGFILIGVGIFILKKRKHKPRIPVYFYKNNIKPNYKCLIFQCIIFTSTCIVLAIAVRTEYWHIALTALVVLILECFLVYKLKDKKKPEFYLYCTNPECFSDFICKRNHASLIAHDNCPSCGEKLSIERKISDTKINPDHIDIKIGKKAEVLISGGIFLVWIFLFLPSLAFLIPEQMPMFPNVILSNHIFLLCWLLLPFFPSPWLVLLLEKSYQKQSIPCPVCNFLINDHTRLNLLKETGNCSNCGASICKSDQTN